MITSKQGERADWAQRLWCSAGGIRVRTNLLDWPDDFIDKATRSEASLDVLSVSICRFWRFNLDLDDLDDASFDYIHDFAMNAFLRGLDVEALRSDLHEALANLEISLRETTKLRNEQGGTE